MGATIDSERESAGNGQSGSGQRSGELGGIDRTPRTAVTTADDRNLGATRQRYLAAQIQQHRWILDLAQQGGIFRVAATQQAVAIQRCPVEVGFDRARMRLAQPCAIGGDHAVSVQFGIAGMTQTGRVVPEGLEQPIRGSMVKSAGVIQVQQIGERIHLRAPPVPLADAEKHTTGRCPVVAGIRLECTRPGAPGQERR